MCSESGREVTGNQNHDYCVIDEVCKLMDKGYSCYLEYEIPIGPSKTKRGYTAVVDIYAIKEKRQILLEIGTLSASHGNRILLLKELKPHAKIIHVHQWKNYGINDYLMRMDYFRWRFINWDATEAYLKDLKEKT